MDNACDEDFEDVDRALLERERAEVDEHAALFRAFYEGNAEDFVANAQAQRDKLLPMRYQLVQHRWEKLYDEEGFRCLRDAIVKQVA